jgi:quercetin dioxygenase-like cupin family protein
VSDIRIVPIAEVAPISLPRGSWTKMLVTGEQVGTNTCSLGYSTFTPGTATDIVAHETEELAYVIAGSGELRRDAGEAVPFRAGDAMFIARDAWHAVVNTGSEDVTMVCVFAHPDYPPTKRYTSVR